MCIRDRHNTATEIGGAIYSENDTFSASDSEFCFNSAGTNGMLFSDTKESSGGAVFLSDCISNTTGSKFIDNSARARCIKALH